MCPPIVNISFQPITWWMLVTSCIWICEITGGSCLLLKFNINIHGTSFPRAGRVAACSRRPCCILALVWCCCFLDRERIGRAGKADITGSCWVNLASETMAFKHSTWVFPVILRLSFFLGRSFPTEMRWCVCVCVCVCSSRRSRFRVASSLAVLCCLITAHTGRIRTDLQTYLLQG